MESMYAITKGIIVFQLYNSKQNGYITFQDQFSFCNAIGMLNASLNSGVLMNETFSKIMPMLYDGALTYSYVKHIWNGLWIFIRNIREHNVKMYEPLEPM